MTAAVNGNSKRYSWWWDSHISPKNSKWLQENLTDMDSKVKQMIKVIEEDADSFARRAEMYYKKRPELMKLVEEFYRAYRALAERYDHATGVIRHAHQTMAEAFPNQDPMMFGDESHVGSSTDEFEPQTPETYPPIRAPVYPNDLQQDALGSPFSHVSSVKKNIAFIEEPQSISNGKGFKTGKARKGLNFNDGDGKGRNVISNMGHDIKVPLESERASKVEAEIIALKDALSKVQAEKEASLAQFDKNLEKLSNLESEISRAQEDSKGLNERATRAETEAHTLRESLRKLETEKESAVLHHQHCLQNIADLEDRISLAQKDAEEVNERASKSEAETIALKQSLVRSETDKEAALVQYRQCLETISNVEERLCKAEEDARLFNERAEKAEVEVESLKQTVSKLVEEKKASELQYQQCLDTIADLKLKLFHAQEETQRLSREIDDGVAKLKFAEEKCLVLERSNGNLHSELDGLLEKLGNQSQELTEKQKEMGRLWTCVQEEHLRFMEAETAFQTLQQLHSQSQEDLNALALELQSRSQILKDMEVRNNDLQEKVQEAKDQNKSLSELNLSSAASIKSLQEEVSSLRDKIQKLEAEVELRVDQRNALQQEIYCLKEELSQIGKKHQSMVEQVELVGLHPECFGSSVKELQEENSELKELKEREESEKMILLEKLVMMEKLVQKNLLLENSISDLNSELETIKGKLKTLEEACQSLVEEKSGLLTEKDMLQAHLQSATENIEKLSEENRLLDNSLFKANAELEELKSKLSGLEDSCRLLNDDKSSLTNERESLLDQIDLMRKSVEDLEKEQTDLKMKVSELGTEREYSLKKIEELGVSLDAKDHEYASFVQFAEGRMNEMESKICYLEGESQCKEREYQVELDRAHDAHIEIIVLQKCLQDLVEKSSSLFSENQNIKEASKLLEKLVSELEQENIEKQVLTDSSINCMKLLRAGIHQVLMKLEIIPDVESTDEKSRDQKIMHDILNKLDEMQTGLLEIWHENQHSAIENLVLVEFIRQLKSEAVGIAAEKKMLEDKFESQHKQLSASQDETQRFIYMSGELSKKISEALNKEELLKVELEGLHKQVMQCRDDYTILQEQNYNTLDEKRHLSVLTKQLEEEKRKVEDDISVLLSETMYQSNLIVFLENTVSEKLSGAMTLNEDLDRLSSSKCKLEKEVKEVGQRLKAAEIEKSQLEGLLEESDTERLSAKSANDQLEHEIADVKEHLGQKEKELLEAMVMISTVQTEKSDISKAVEDFECRYKEAKAIAEEKDEQALKLRDDHDELIKKNNHANEKNQKLETHVVNLLMELEEIKSEKENLNQELFKEKNEVETWESQAATLFGDLQISAVQETLLQGLTHELAEACKSLEKRSTLKDVEIDELHGRVNNLEDANKGQNDIMSKYAQAIVLLKESIKSLENHFNMPLKFGNEPVDGTDLAMDHDDSSSLKTDSTKEDGFLELHELHFRIKAIEEALSEKEKLAMEELKSAAARRSKRKEQGRRSGSLRIPNHEIYTEGSEMITKDIVLDQVSDCSSYGISKKDTLKIEDNDHSFEAKTQKSEKGKSLSEESLIVDKLEISDRFTDPNKEVNKRKVLERLDSDLQKLSDLQITVEELKSKVDIDEKHAKGEDDYETIKGQINEAEEAIEKLLSINKKLMTKVEGGFARSDGSLSSIDLDETESSRRRRISEQARRGSEKIGRLQLEIQRLHFQLLKLEGKREENAKVKVLESKRTLLRDYIYGGVRGERRKKIKKRFAFCGCVQPPGSP